MVRPQYFIPVAPTPPREPFSIARSFTQNERQSHGDCNTPRVSQRDEQRRRQEKSMASSGRKGGQGQRPPARPPFAARSATGRKWVLQVKARLQYLRLGDGERLPAASTQAWREGRKSACIAPRFRTSTDPRCRTDVDPHCHGSQKRERATAARFEILLLT